MWYDVAHSRAQLWYPPTCEGQFAVSIFTLHVVADVPRGVAGGLQCGHMQTANLQ